MESNFITKVKTLLNKPIGFIVLFISLLVCVHIYDIYTTKDCEWSNTNAQIIKIDKLLLGSMYIYYKFNVGSENYASNIKKYQSDTVMNKLTTQDTLIIR